MTGRWQWSPTPGGTPRPLSRRCRSSGARGGAGRGRVPRTGTPSAAKDPQHLSQGLTSDDAYAGRNEGEALKAIAGAAKKVEAIYATPFLAHATIEPMNCTARITADRGEVWVPTQNAEASLAALSEVS